MSTPKQAERQGRILRAALAEFSRAGFVEGSIDRIARGAGVAKTTIYRHFPHKGELFRAVFLEALDRLAEVVRIRPVHPGFEENLRRGIRNLLREIGRDPGAFLVFRTMGPDSTVSDPALYRDLAKAYLDWGAWAVEELRTAQALGKIRPDLDPERLHMAILGLIHSQVHLRIRHGRSFDLSRSADLIGDILFQGIVPAKPSRGGGKR